LGDKSCSNQALVESPSHPLVRTIQAPWGGTLTFPQLCSYNPPHLIEETKILPFERLPCFLKQWVMYLKILVF
jgi:hypothetical protein